MFETIGHEQAEKQIEDAIASGKIHHAWLISGHRGIGKATLAYKFASLLLGQGAIPRIKNNSHADFKVIQSEDGKIKVDEAREIGKFLSLTPAESKYRVVIIDPIDDMNSNAANAILKVLEEPPKNTVLILVSHTIGKLLPTIRSRCRSLVLKSLDFDDFKKGLKLVLDVNPSDEEIFQLHKLSQGSIGIAIELYQENGIEIYKQIKSLAGSGRTSEIYSFAEKIAKDKWEIFTWLIRCYINERAKSGAGDCSQLWDKTNQLIKQTDVIYLDKKQVVANILS